MDLANNNTTEVETGSAADLGIGGGEGGGGSAEQTLPAEQGGEGGEGASSEFLAQFSSEVGDGESASNRDYVQSKGFKDLDGLVSSYRGAEKGLHDKGMVKVPGEGATEQELAAFRTAIGVPEKAEDYARPEFKDSDGNPIAYNAELTDRVLESAHKHGAPKSVIENILHDEIQWQIEQHDEAQKQLEAAANEHVKSWGADSQAKIASVNAALKDLGLSREDVQHMRAMPSGPGKFLDAMAKVGANYSEDALIKGDTQRFGMSAEDAQKTITEMKGNPETVKKIKIPGSAERQRWDRANEVLGAAANT